MASVQQFVAVVEQALDVVRDVAVADDDDTVRMALQDAAHRLTALRVAAEDRWERETDVADWYLDELRQALEDVRGRLQAFLARAPVFVCGRGHQFSPPPPSTCGQDGTAVRRA